jgi:hypothetical protein
MAAESKVCSLAGALASRDITVPAGQSKIDESVTVGFEFIAASGESAALN